ncbi:MAG: response regulator transcription factor [Anaerolineae bacterium]
MSETTSQIRVLLADDHAVVRAGLRLLLEQQGDLQVVGEASDGLQALNMVRELKPDVLLLDLSMPGLGGLGVLGKIKSLAPEVRVLVLTMHGEEDYARQVLSLGGSGYILKQSADELVVNAIRQVHAGKLFIDPTLIGTLLSDMIPTDTSHDPWDELSEREQEVITLVAWGYTGQEIAERLHLSVNTVDTYRGRAMQKLGFTSRVQLVRYAVARGLLNE